MTTGKALVFNENLFELKHHPLPQLKTKEILVKIEMCSVCGSDLHTYTGRRSGPSPSILGHEIIGHIVELGSSVEKDLNGKTLQLGDRISWSVFSSEPDSLLSHKGMRQKSDKLVKYGHHKISEHYFFSGGMATHCHLLANTCVIKLPNEIPGAVLCPANCSMATIAGAYRLSRELRGKHILITGCGMLGIHAIAYAHAKGAASIIVTDINPKRLAMAKLFGATQTINLLEVSTNIEQLITERYPQLDLHIEVSGALGAMQLGLDCLSIGGTAIWLGAVFPQNSLQVNTEQIVRKILTIKGLHNYNEEDLKTSIQFLSAYWQNYPFEKLVEKEFQLEHAKAAFEYSLKNKPFRVAFRP